MVGNARAAMKDEEISFPTHTLRVTLWSFIQCLQQNVCGAYARLHMSTCDERHMMISKLEWERRKGKKKRVDVGAHDETEASE